MNQELFDRIARVKERIAEAAAATGRTEKDIVLLGATKMQSAETVAAALPFLDAVGENRVQELTEKMAAGAYHNGIVHMIGHLQSNKVNKVAGKVDLIQSVDSLHLARVISDCMVNKGAVQSVLLEINIGREEAKSGFLPEALDEAIPAAAALPGIRIRGIMAIPPVFSGDRCYFRALSQLFIDIKEKKYDNVLMEFLSMGMSRDYYEAILEGSNMVRIGTAIFGERTYSGKD